MAYLILQQLLDKTANEYTRVMRSDIVDIHVCTIVKSYIDATTLDTTQTIQNIKAIRNIDGYMTSSHDNTINEMKTKTTNPDHDVMAEVAGIMTIIKSRAYMTNETRTVACGVVSAFDDWLQGIVNSGVQDRVDFAKNLQLLFKTIVVNTGTATSSTTTALYDIHNACMELRYLKKHTISASLKQYIAYLIQCLTVTIHGTFVYSEVLTYTGLTLVKNTQSDKFSDYNILVRCDTIIAVHASMFTSSTSRSLSMLDNASTVLLQFTKKRVYDELVYIGTFMDDRTIFSHNMIVDKIQSTLDHINDNTPIVRLTLTPILLQSFVNGVRQFIETISTALYNNTIESMMWSPVRALYRIQDNSNEEMLHRIQQMINSDNITYRFRDAVISVPNILIQQCSNITIERASIDIQMTMNNNGDIRVVTQKDQPSTIGIRTTLVSNRDAYDRIRSIIDKIDGEYAVISTK